MVPIKPFSDQEILRVRDNIFPGAHAAIADWNSFPWHAGPRGRCDSNQVNSSQALAVDVFGTFSGSVHRDDIFNLFAESLNLPQGESWVVRLEYLSETNPLNELRLTQVDAVAESESALIFFECKFTEGDGGSCRQPLPLTSGAHKSQVQCNGRYSLQRNPVNGIEARCALAGKGIRYWDFVPRVFWLASDVDYEACPFRYAWYQWMRNLVNCYAIAEMKGKKPGFVVVFADAPGLAMAQKVRSPEWQYLEQSVRKDAIAFHTLSYQDIIALAGVAAPNELATWADLIAWVETKIQHIAV